MNTKHTNDALERLEWQRLLSHLADLALFEKVKQQLSELKPELPFEERAYHFQMVRECRHLLNQTLPLALEPLDETLFSDALRLGAQLSALALWEVRTLALLLDRVSQFYRDQKKSHQGEKIYPRLMELVEPVLPQPKLLARLNQSVDAQGNILSTASPDLRAARSKLEVTRKKIVESLENLLRRNSVRDALQDAVWMQRDGRYVLPVRTDRKADVPGTPRGVSGSGSTVFVEPAELGSLQTQLELAETEVQVEEARVLRELSELCHALKDDLFSGLRALELFDHFRAKSLFAQKLDAIEPKFHADKSSHPAFQFLQARHPLFLLDDKLCVPNDLVLDSSIWVLSGPNAGGKTVAMKTAGILTLMALAGLCVPAAEARLFEFSEVFAEMGDRQNLADDLSTFSGHLVQMKNILDHASPRTLVLLDEGFVGTDPTIGVAMARATLEMLADKGATCIITTHFSGLKSLAESDVRFHNGSMEFEPRRLKPTYHLRNGIPGQSYALELATRLDFPASLLDAARSYAGEEMMRVEKLVAELSRQKEELEKQIEEHTHLSAQLKQQIDATEKEHKETQFLKETLVESYRNKLQKRLNAFENRLEIRERQFEKNKQNLLREIELSRFDSKPPDPSTPRTVQSSLAGSVDSAQNSAKKAPPAAPSKAIPQADGARSPKGLTLSGFDALQGLKLGRNAAPLGSAFDDLDAKAARARTPAKLNARDLLDEARESLASLGRGFDAIEEDFDNDIDALEELTRTQALKGKTTEKAKQTLADMEKHQRDKASAARPPASHWKPGLRVKTQRFKEAGAVVKVADGKGLVECQFGLLKVKIPHEELRTLEEVANSGGILNSGGKPLPKSHTNAPIKNPSLIKSPVKITPTTGGKQNNMRMDIDPTFPHKGNTVDVRGELVDTALERVEDFFDKAFREGITQFLIIHGHGTGRVKQAVRALLTENKLGVEWRPGTSGEGSDGVTVVRLVMT
jgi:DNA mismatch repair protein MutS2